MMKITTAILSMITKTGNSALKAKGIILATIVIIIKMS
jgi:hypothetical protein